MGYDKNRLLAGLPALAATTGKWMPSFAVDGMRRNLGLQANPNELIQFRTGRTTRDHYYVIRPRVDVFNNNAHRRHLMDFTGSRRAYMNCLNGHLGGGEDYPVTLALMGILMGAAGAVGAAAGALFSLTSAIVSNAKPRQSVRIREGDQLWHLEQLGTVRGEIVHSSCFVVVDPLRKQREELSHAWVVHEARREVLVA